MPPVGTTLALDSHGEPHYYGCSFYFRGVFKSQNWSLNLPSAFSVSLENMRGFYFLSTIVLNYCYNQDTFTFKKETLT